MKKTVKKQFTKNNKRISSSILFQNVISNNLSIILIQFRLFQSKKISIENTTFYLCIILGKPIYFRSFKKNFTKSTSIIDFVVSIIVSYPLASLPLFKFNSNGHGFYMFTNFIQTTFYLNNRKNQAKERFPYSQFCKYARIY